MWPFKRKQREPDTTPKVWVTVNGLSFYIPVTDPFVELAYGPMGAAALRQMLLGSKAEA